MTRLPLSGVRVLEVGDHLATSYIGYLLAGQGADVVAVSNMRQGDEATLHHPLAAGKRIIRADIASAHVQDQVGRLTRRADVLITATLGRSELEWLKPDVTRRENPRLISCDITATDPRDPQTGVYGDEAVVAAAAGLHNDVLTDASTPLWNEMPVPSYFAGLLGVLAVAMALLDRSNDRQGNSIEVSLFDAALFANGARLINVGAGPHEGGTRDIFGAGFYECSDGRFIRLSTDNPRFMERFVGALGVEGWKQEGLLDRAKLRANPTLRAELYSRMAVLIKSRPSAYWDSTLNDAGMPVGVVSSPNNWLANKHALESASVQPRDRGAVLWGIGQPLSIDEDPVQGPSATLIEGFDGVWPGAAPDVTKLKVASGRPLEGVRVLDATTVVAGPLSTRMLAEYGATVIKVLDPNNLPEGLKYHFDVNRGKRTGSFDLKDETDAEFVFGLARQADVFVHNLSFGTMERLGFGERDLRSVNRSLIYAAISAYGSQGPWKERRGYESQAQAVTGMVHRYSGSGRPRQLPVLVNDYGTGILTALGIVLTLIRRQRTGQGGVVRTSLTQSATFAQAPLWNQTYKDSPQQNGFEGPPLRRMFATSDGWLMLAARRTQLVDLDILIGAAETVPLHELPDSRLVSVLEGVFRTRATTEWVTSLSGAGILAHEVVSIEKAAAASRARSRGLITDVRVRGGTSFSASGIAVRTHRNAPKASRWAEPPGSSTELIRDRAWEIATNDLEDAAEERKK